MDAGFILALPLHHGDLELDTVGVSMKDHVAILVSLAFTTCQLRVS